MLFSATLDGVVGKPRAARDRQSEAHRHRAGAEDQPDITQHALFADNHAHKAKLLDTLLRDTEIDQALVFTATKRGAETLHAS